MDIKSVKEQIEEIEETIAYLSSEREINREELTDHWFDLLSKQNWIIIEMLNKMLNKGR